ncbi:hypothetical protein PJJ30_23940 [Mycobacterium kansasii]|uniref:Uncharacterized protein n=1 Tax=Mycobacterium persicum TaxID=1487726 RepID=A0ABY6RSN2_9MYCO|nr:hypothetical protein [Mycobacterium persicum]VBA33120.1 hypothetical protein LAUMK4_05882 [Mycobacterium persicum]
MCSPTYRIISDDDDQSQRIIAVTSADIELCGAYRPGRLNDWRFYLCKLATGLSGLPQPHKAHVCSRDDANRWIDTIAWHYTQVEALRADNALLRSQNAELTAAIADLRQRND